MSEIKRNIKGICIGINEGFQGDRNRQISANASLEKALNLMGEYVAAVTNMEAGLQIARFRLEGEEYRDYVQRLDRQRRAAHDAMIARVSAVNRICGMIGHEAFFTGDIDDRYAVADFAWAVVQEIFEERDNNVDEDDKRTPAEKALERIMDEED